MNFNHLKAFVKVVQTKSYQETAKILSISQPAVTLRVKAIEDHFQTKLLQRKSDGVTLTPQGEALYKEFQHILQKWEQLEYHFLSDQPVGCLTLGASTIPSEYLLPELLRGFRLQYPDVDFKMKVSGTKEVISWLLKRKVDVIVTGRPEENENIGSSLIYHDHLKIILPTTVQDEITSFSDLLSFDWILREKHSDTRQAWEEALAKHGYKQDQLTVAAQMGSTEAVIAAVEAGLGVSAVSSLAADRAEKHGRIKVVELDDIDVIRPFYVSFLKENRTLPMIAAFSQYLNDYRFKK